jgi:hypothetical protein
MRGESDTYRTGTLAGAGSFRCRQCGFAVALNALEEVPRCPSCGNARFARASMFDASGLDETPTLGGTDDGDWLAAVREELEEPGHYLVHRHDDGHVCLMPLVSEWTRIGRSLTADIRFDDPTVSRRHAIIVRQSGHVRVLDDRSLNGLFLRGERVEWGELEDGDELIIGRYRLFFLDHAAQSSPSDLGVTTTAA